MIFKSLPRHQSKIEIMIRLAKIKIEKGQVVWFSYHDLTFGLKQLRYYFPNALFEIVNSNAIRVHERITNVYNDQI